MNQITQKKFNDQIKLPLQQNGYEIIKTLGKGAFGQVFMASKNSKNYAIKSISKTHVKKRPFLEKYIKQQIQAMNTLKHPNLVAQQKVIQTQQYYFMILEYCDMGNLLTFQSKLKTKSFSIKEGTEILVEIMKGLKVIHQKNYIHRDLKSQNVLIKATEKGKIYKIADFGFARPMKSGTASTVCGTEKYMAPQILKNLPYNRSVDIWALGILLYFMLFAQYPFKGHDLMADVQKKCSNGFSLKDCISKVDKLKDTTPQVQDFFRKIFVIDAKKRITFSGIISHPLFSRYQAEFQQNKQFYEQTQNKDTTVNPDTLQTQQINMDDDDETSNTVLMPEIQITSQNKAIAKEIETTNFEICKIAYLRQCANDFYQNYSSVINFEDRVAIRYYVLRAFIFYCKSLIQSLDNKKIPAQFSEYKMQKWSLFAQSEQYKVLLSFLKEESFRGESEFQDSYMQAKEILDRIKIKGFKDKFTSNIDEAQFEGFKISYRSTTSYIFKKVHENKQVDSHIKNKLKLKLFCCHMINRIFDQNEIDTNFEYYVKWLKTDRRKVQSKFDFANFKKWIVFQSKENLDKNIILLHKIFFSK